MLRQLAFPFWESLLVQKLIARLWDLVTNPVARDHSVSVENVPAAAFRPVFHFRLVLMGAWEHPFLSRLALSVLGKGEKQILESEQTLSHYGIGTSSCVKGRTLGIKAER